MWRWPLPTAHWGPPLPYKYIPTAPTAPVAPRRAARRTACHSKAHLFFTFTPQAHHSTCHSTRILHMRYAEQVTEAWHAKGGMGCSTCVPSLNRHTRLAGWSPLIQVVLAGLERTWLVHASHSYSHMYSSSSTLNMHACVTEPCSSPRSCRGHRQHACPCMGYV